MANQQEQQVMAAFVQWLPKNIAKFQGQIPDEVITPIANAKDENEVVNVLNQLSQSEEGNQLVAGMFQVFQKEASGETGMFKEGGKLAYGIKKFWFGGKGVDTKKYNVVINAPGDTTYTMPYKYRVETRQTYPDGSVRMSTLTKNELNHSWDPNMAKPGFWRRLIFGSKVATPERVQNWNELLINHKNDTNVLDKTK